MKDDLPSSLPPLDAVVAWQETYVTSHGILGHRVVWGQVRDHHYHRGNLTDFPIEGYYVQVFLQDGTDLIVHTNDIILVQP